MRINNKEFYVDFNNQTRISLIKTDEELSSVDQLPSFLVECHVFRDGNMAESFVQGVQYVGLGNSVVMDWNPGSLDANKCVLVGRLDEPRPDSDDLSVAIKFVEHSLGNHDSAAIAAGTQRSIDETRRFHENNKERCKPIADALINAGANPKKLDYYSGCIRFEYPKGYFAEVNFKVPTGPYQIKTSCYELFEGTLDVSDVVIAKAAEYGFILKRSGRELSFEDIQTAEDIPAKLEMMKEVEEACRKAKLDAWHQDFVKNTKVTKPRKRFLTAGWEAGYVRSFNRRNNTVATVDGIEIGQTEINVMLKMGWMVSGGQGYMITEDGAKAAGIDLEAAASPRM